MVGVVRNSREKGLTADPRPAASLLTLFAVLALVVCAVRVYGMLSYAVSERTREMGIRLAHGARDLLALVVGDGMVPTITGLVVCLGASLALTRLIQRFSSA